MVAIPAALQHKGRFRGLRRIHRGKVRDTFDLPGYPHLMLVVCTNRISIFDFVLNGEVALKAEVLNAINLFWVLMVFTELRHDIVAYGSAIDQYLPVASQGNAKLHRRAVVVRRLQMIPVELVVRGYIDGSALTAAQERRVYCGHTFPEGLKRGSRLAETIFTPTTKGEGKDLPLDYRAVEAEYGPELTQFALTAYERALQVARMRGLILGDTKFEVGRDPATDELILADERLSPDSSRYWDLQNWEEAMAGRAALVPLDKQLVRDWGRNLGMTGRSPTKAEDIAWVHERCPLPEEVANVATGVYLQLFERLTGMTLARFQGDIMGIAV